MSAVLDHDPWRFDLPDQAALAAEFNPLGGLNLSFGAADNYDILGADIRLHAGLRPDRQFVVRQLHLPLHFAIDIQVLAATNLTRDMDLAAYQGRRRECGVPGGRTRRLSGSSWFELTD